MKKKKIRLDNFLFGKGFFDSREKARRAIMAGQVFVNGNRACKAGQSYAEDITVELKGKTCPYVSRGGLKLEKAVRIFSLDLNNCIAMDIGASTGGFTDCMLQEGAARVYSVDVGYGQIAWKLRQDERVTLLERVNARYLKEEDIGEKVNIITIDVSFISITKILPVVKDLLLPEGKVIALIKPQFEAGKELVGKGGVVRKKETHIKVIKDILSFFSKEGFLIRDLDYSPVRGPAGNIEFLLYLEKGDPSFEEAFPENKVENCVAEAHRFFEK